MILEDSRQDRYREFFERSLALQCIAGLDGYFKAINSAWEEALGYSREELMARPFVEFVHPDDQAATIREAALLAEGADSIQFENRYRMRQGGYRWLLWTASADLEAGLIYATAGDVTERKQLEEQLQLLQSLSRTIAQASNLDSALELVLRELCEVTGWEIGEAWVPNEDETALVLTDAWVTKTLELATFRAAGQSRTLRKGQELVGRAWASGTAVGLNDLGNNRSFTRRAEAQQLHLVSGVAIPVTAEGKTVAVLDFFSRAREVDEEQRLVELVTAIGLQLGTFILRKRAEDDVANAARTFRELSLRDDLTGLLNRRGFVTLAEHYLAVIRRTGEVATLLYIDIDSMKQINDEFGHGEGDNALRDVGEAIQQSFRESDVAARLGGDEFCVLLSGGEEVEAATTARLRQALATSASERKYALSVSYGWARLTPESPASLGELLEEADGRLYRAKARTDLGGATEVASKL